MKQLFVALFVALAFSSPARAGELLLDTITFVPNGPFAISGKALLGTSESDKLLSFSLALRCVGDGYSKHEESTFGSFSATKLRIFIDRQVILFESDAPSVSITCNLFLQNHRIKPVFADNVSLTLWPK